MLSLLHEQIMLRQCPRHFFKPILIMKMETCEMCLTPKSISVSGTSGKLYSKRNIAYKWYHTLCFSCLCLNPLSIISHISSGRQKKNNPYRVECQAVMFMSTSCCVKWLKHLSGVLHYSHRKTSVQVVCQAKCFV